MKVGKNNKSKSQRRKFFQPCGIDSPQELLFFHSENCPNLGEFVRVAFDNYKTSSLFGDTKRQNLLGLLKKLSPGENLDAINNLPDREMRHLIRALTHVVSHTAMKDETHCQSVRMLLNTAQLSEDWRRTIVQDEVFMRYLMSAIMNSSDIDAEMPNDYMRLLKATLKSYHAGYPEEEVTNFLDYIVVKICDGVLDDKPQTRLLYIIVLSRFLKNNISVQAHVKAKHDGNNAGNKTKTLPKRLIEVMENADTETMVHCLSCMAELYIHDPQEKTLFNKDCLDMIFGTIFSVAINSQGDRDAGYSEELQDEAVCTLQRLLRSVDVLTQLLKYNRLESSLRTILETIKELVDTASNRDGDGHLVHVRHLLGVFEALMQSSAMQKLVCQLLVHCGSTEMLLKLSCHRNKLLSLPATRFIHKVITCRHSGLQSSYDEAPTQMTFVQACTEDSIAQALADALLRRIRSVHSRSSAKQALSFCAALTNYDPEAILNQFLKLLHALCTYKNFCSKFAYFIDVDEVQSLLDSESLAHEEVPTLSVINLLMTISDKVSLVKKYVKKMTRQHTIHQALGNALNATEHKDCLHDGLTFLQNCTRLSGPLGIFDKADGVLQDLVAGLLKYNKDSIHEIKSLSHQVYSLQKSNKKYQNLHSRSIQDIKRKDDKLRQLSKQKDTELDESRKENEKRINKMMTDYQAERAEHEKLIQESRQQISELEQEIEQKRENTNSVKFGMAQLKSKYRQLEMEYSEVERQNANLRIKVEELVMRSNSQTEREQSIRAEEGKVRRHAEKLEKDIKSWQDKLKKAATEKENLSNKNNDLNNNINNVYRELIVMCTAYKDQQKENKRTADKLSDKVRDLEKSSEDCKFVKSELKTVQSNLKRKEHQLKNVQENRDELNDRCDKFSIELRKRDMEITDLNKAVQDKTKNITTLEATVKKKEQDLTDAEDDLDEMEAELAKFKNIMAAMQSVDPNKGKKRRRRR